MKRGAGYRSDTRSYGSGVGAVGRLSRQSLLMIPSLDLVMARVASGPASLDEAGLIGSVVAAISAEESSP
jgi:hypothetical protein